MAARTDIESANAELARIEAEFAKFKAAHTRTDAVIRKLRAGQNEAHTNARAVANASGEANAKVHGHARDDAHARSSAPRPWMGRRSRHTGKAERLEDDWESLAPGVGTSARPFALDVI